MRLEINELDASTTCLVLAGRMDAPGCETIDMPFTAAASAAGRHVVVDLSAVSYVGSLGIRLLISNARLLMRAGRRLVIFGAQPQPLDVFETVALADLIPIAGDRDEALGLLAG